MPGRYFSVLQLYLLSSACTEDELDFQSLMRICWFSLWWEFFGIADFKFLEMQIDKTRSMSPGRYSLKSRPDCFLKMVCSTLLKYFLNINILLKDMQNDMLLASVILLLFYVRHYLVQVFSWLNCETQLESFHVLSSYALPFVYCILLSPAFILTANFSI